MDLFYSKLLCRLIKTCNLRNGIEIVNPCIEALIRPINFISSEVTLYLFKSTIWTLMVCCCYVWDCASDGYMCYNTFTYVHLNLLTSLLVLILVWGLLVFPIGRRIFLSTFRHVKMISESTVFFRVQLDQKFLTRTRCSCDLWYKWL